MFLTATHDTTKMFTILLMQPGATDFDNQGRIKGSLDFPLSESGVEQVARVRDDLAKTDIDAIYAGPCRSAQETAEMLAERRAMRVRSLEGLRNIDHGLWQGKLIEEIKRNQPKAFRLGQAHAREVCPPEGESIEDAKHRVQSVLRKLLKRHRKGTVALVISEPLISLFASELEGRDLEDLWQAEQDQGKWRVVKFPTKDHPVLGSLGNAS